MIKTLIISVDDPDLSGALTIAGTNFDNSEFNKIVTIAIGGAKIAVNSQDLAQALAAVVDFQTPVRQATTVSIAAAPFVDDQPLMKWGKDNG